MKKDKQKVLGEKFDDERIKTFLTIDAPEGVNIDYHRLEKAYRGMTFDSFERFISFFVEAGGNINATCSDGKTFLQTITSQRLADEYVDALKKAGAE